MAIGGDRAFLGMVAVGVLGVLVILIVAIFGRHPGATTAVKLELPPVTTPR